MVMYEKPTYKELEERIQKLKRAELERKHAKENLQLTQFSVDNSTDAVYWIGPDAKFLYVNYAAVAALGYSKKELLTMTVHDIGPEFPADIWPAHWAELKEKKSFVIQTIHQRKDGSTFPVEITVNFIQFGSREINCAIARDITDRKRTEEVLRESEARFRLLYEKAPIGYQSLDKNGYFIEVNQAWLDTLGYNKNEVLGKSFGDFLHPEWANHFKKNFPRFKAVGEILGVEFEMVKKDGSMILVSFNGKIGNDRDGDFKQTHCVLHDITEARRVEKEIKKFKTVADSALNGQAIVDLEGNITYINNYFAKTHGYSSDELIGKNLSIFHNKRQMVEVEKINKSLKGNGSYGPMEVWHTHKDGAEFPMLMNGVLIKDEGGTPQYMAATAIDITDLKQAETEREKSMSLLEVTLESTADGILVVDEKRKWSGFNRKFIDMWNIPAHIQQAGDDRQALNHVLENLIDPEGFKARVQKLYQDVSATYFDVIELKDGRTFEGYSQPQKLEGKIIGRVWSFRDITERKQAEDSLTESMRKYQFLAENVTDVIWSLNMDLNFNYISPSVEKLRGYKPAEAVQLPLEQTFTPTSYKKVLQVITEEIDRDNEPGVLLDRSVTLELDMFHKDGGSVPVEISASFLRDEGGSPTGIIGITRDITERKQAEMALINSERKWRNILINTPQIGIALDPQAKITFANAHFLRLTGWMEQEIIGQDWFDLFIPEYVREEVRAVFNTVMSQKDALGFSNYENEIIIKSGALRNVAWSNVLTKDSHENIVDVTCLGIDLTETRRTEEELRQSEERQRSMLQTAMDGFWLTDPKGRLLEVNETYSQMSGYNKEELLSMSISDLEANEMPEDVAAHAQRIIKMGQDRFESWHRRKDGTLFEVEVSAQYRLDDGGRFVCFIRDITGLKEAERSLRKSDERLKLALDSVTDAVWDWQVDTGEVYFSSRWYTMLGYKPYELPQDFETWLQLLHPDDLQKSEKTVFHHLELAEPFEIEFRMRTKDGQWRWILARGKTVEKDKKGKAVRMLGTHMDITERKKMEEQIQQAQKMESVGNLAGGIAHDFNNILFPIVGMSELLLEDLLPGSSEHLSVQEILKAGKRGSELVKQILALSRQSEHKMIPVRMQQILKEVLKLIHSTIPADIEITQNIQKDCGFVMADATQLHQIAMNLITNAYHAVETSGGNISIKLLESECDGKNLPSAYLDPGRYVVLSISDTGCGIDPAIMDKIFEPYFTTKGQGKGTGLGLSVVYGLVKEHGGEIKVDSEIGKGTTFDVYLPRIADQTKQEPAETLEINPTGTERILLVDDEEPIVRVVKQMLERLGYHIVERSSSPDALKAFTENPSAFDLVISDMTMPNLTGDRLARKLIAVRPDIPIIICTGFSERIDKEKASALGIKGFIMKPVVRSEMAKMVRKILDEAKGKTQ